MVLVGYSDSEGSDADEQPKTVPKPAAKTPPTTNFAVDKANPKKIRINLNESLPPVTAREDGEPAPKRARVGGGAFSGFNAMLPAPKRDNEKPASASNGHKPARKVFSLKTGAEPAFNREADAELKELFAQQDQEPDSAESTTPKPSFISDTPKPMSTQGKPLMFKPLSVARNNKKKKPASQLLPPTEPHPSRSDPTPTDQSSTAQPHSTDHIPPPKPKINLFSSGPNPLPPDIDDPDPDPDPTPPSPTDPIPQSESLHQPHPSTAHQPTLSSLATTLNLTPSERRQLLGRNSASATSTNIITFNTESEYAANQALIAAGDQAAQQHNPVKAIAPGKHSLKSLVASAQGQKEALEESFAAGRKNKREGGSKYGW